MQLTKEKISRSYTSVNVVFCTFGCDKRLE